MPACKALIAAAACGLWSVAAAAQNAGNPPVSSPVPTVTLAPVDVIGTSPLPGIGIDRDKVPANAQTMPAPDIAVQGPAPLVSGLDQRIGSISINDNEDNPYQPDIQYRGLTASPVLGTPTGLAVYQNGIRLNEPFGDSVTWDLVPDFAIDQLSIIPTNPLYGLNALGGALILNMKNGFTYQGGEFEVQGGSFGQRQFTLQYGRQIGNFAAYLGLNAANEDGYRKLSPAQIRQLYADIGAEGTHGGLHLNFTAASNVIAGIGPTPIQLVNVDRTAVFVSPQTFRDTLLMPALNANYIASDTLSFQGNFYVRSSGRKSEAGNISDVIPCDDSIPNTLCLDDPTNVLFSTSGRPVPNVLNGLTPAENDNTSTTSFGLGASLQATYTAPLWGHDNHLVAGVSWDHGDVDFSSYNEVATVPNINTLVTQGTGFIIQQPDGSLDPVRLETTNSYYGVFASDTFNVTPALAVTVGGRYNLALIRLYDKIGTDLNGNNRFSRFNPAAGLTYKFTPNLTGYFGYAEANRTPTAGELGCSDPARPCTLDAFLSADPPGLKQVVAHSYEAGLRGKFDVAALSPEGRMQWNLGVFRTDLDDDILTVPSDILSTGFFRNIGSTRRQGIEAGIGYRDEKWQLSANYSLVDATFESDITLSSPDNPGADAAGNVHVRPGNRIPGIPEHRFKLNADFKVTDRWTVGGNLVVVSDRYFFNDQSNLNPTMPGYAVVNLHTSYRVTDNIEVFALVKNLFDERYSTYGIYNDPTKSPLPGVANPSDPRFVSVAAPLAAYGGVRIKF